MPEITAVWPGEPHPLGASYGLAGRSMALLRVVRAGNGGRP